MRTLNVLFVTLPFMPGIFPHQKTALSPYDIPKFPMTFFARFSRFDSCISVHM